VAKNSCKTTKLAEQIKGKYQDIGSADKTNKQISLPQFVPRTEA
jgi:hypothetical protein